MKIEMGESLLRAYFKDVKECLITQTNWKVSENWKADESDSAQLQDIYEKIRSDSNFADAFKTELAQTLRQAEVDVIGIDAAGKLYLAEVAFHEAGLNYGSKTETKDRVIKKLLRAWLAAMKFFPGHRYEIIFASPKVNPATDKIIREYFDILSESFESPDAHFAYYANDSFRDEILLPTYEKSRAESDTSDLFIRSVRLLDLFSLVSAEKPKATAQGLRSAQAKGKKDDTKYTMNGTPTGGKGPTVYAAVEHYVKSNPGITFEQLQVAFPDEAAKPGFGKMIRLFEQVSQNEWEGSRFNKHPITLATGQNVVVSTQWKPDNMRSFIECAGRAGITIESQ